MVGILVNTLAVALGGLFGLFFKKHITSEFIAGLTMIFGVCSMGMGISVITQMENMPAVVLALVAGTALGLACHIGDRIASIGLMLQKPVDCFFGSRSASSDQREQSSLLITTIVLFCTSSTGIYGSLDAGMTGNISVLLSKSVLDFFTALVFACTLGAVVSVVAVPQFLIFTAMFLSAKTIYPLTTPEMICDFRACGGFLMLAAGLRVAQIKELPIADMIPAMFLVMPLSSLWHNVVLAILK